MRTKPDSPNPTQHEPLDHQINVRWTHSEHARLEEIAAGEDRTLSTVVRFLTRWALEAYTVVPSIRGLQLTNISGVLSRASDTLTARALPVASIEEGSAQARLDLRAEAAKKYDKERAPKTSRARKQG